MSKLRGRTTNGPLHIYLIYLFEAQPRKRLTDAQLIQALKREYPECSSDAWTEELLRLKRNQYNRGELPMQKVKPKNPVLRYGPNGKELPAQRGPSAKLK